MYDKIWHTEKVSKLTKYVRANIVDIFKWELFTFFSLSCGYSIGCDKALLSSMVVISKNLSSSSIRGSHFNSSDKSRIC